MVAFGIAAGCGAGRVLFLLGGHDEEENDYVYTLNQYTGEFDIADEKVHY